MGWDPGDVNDVTWSVPRRGPTKEARLAGNMMEYRTLELPEHAEVTLEGRDLIFKADSETGYKVEYARVVTMEDGDLHIEPGPPTA